MTTHKLPASFTLDWHDRQGDEHGARIISTSARYVMIDLPPAALAALIADATYYAHDMAGDWTGGIDYRPAARRVLARLI